MKAIIVNRIPGTTVGAPPSITIVPSSAIIAPGKPLFLPDWAEDWNIVPAFAVRLNRLGKAIGQKFAYRYYDAIVPVAMLHTETLDSRPDLSGFAGAFDGAMAIGLPYENIHEGTHSLEIGGVSLSIDRRSSDIDMAISILSRYMTLQMGDLIVPGLPPASIPVGPGSTIHGTLNGTAAITVKIR